MKKYEIPETLIIAILHYLSKQPHKKVDAIIKSIHQLRAVEQPKNNDNNLKPIRNET
jgi:hypothetical protein